MASLTLKEMEEHGLHDLCVDLCKNIINSQTSDGSEIQYLLPVKYIISNWGMYDSVEWKNPITEEEYVEPFSSELTRVQAVQEINKRIDDYNAEVEKLDSQYDDLEERVAKQLYRKRSPYQLYSLTAWMHKPVHKRKNPTNNWQKAPFDARHFNSEPVFDRIMACTTEEEAVGKFNKMLYEYIMVVTDGKQLIETSTFYYPKLEFEDYMMRSGCAEYINLLEEQSKGLEYTPSPFESMYPVNNYTSVDVQKDVMSRSNHPQSHKIIPVPEAKPEDYRLTIDWDNQTITAKDIARDRIEDVTATFKQCGLLGVGNKPNRFVTLLMAYAFYQAESKDKPPIEKERLWNDLVLGKKSHNTFYRYQKGLTMSLTHLLDLWGWEGLNRDVATLFVSVKEKLKQRNTKGKVETIPIKYFECVLDLRLKSYAKELRETPSGDFMESWHSDLDMDIDVQ